MNTNLYNALDILALKHKIQWRLCSRQKSMLKYNKDFYYPEVEHSPNIYLYVSKKDVLMYTESELLEHLELIIINNIDTESIKLNKVIKREIKSGWIKHREYVPYTNAYLQNWIYDMPEYWKF